MADWMGYLEEHQSRFLNEFLSLLRIPSISTDPAAAGAVRQAAEWVAERLRQAGMDGVRILETGGHPAVYGQWCGAPGRPTVLIYGHFDVQPVDPLHLWTHPPFEPAVVDGRVYARGATDMKGNLLLPIVACEALLRTEGQLPVNVKFLLEGEEEIGSPNLGPLLEAHRDLLACDLMVSADGGCGTPERPEVWLGPRGLVGLQINVRTADRDLHSGNGGLAPNAIHALVRLLDSMRDSAGRITVEGFYDSVRPLSDTDRAEIAAAAYPPAEYQSQTGVRGFFGEPEFTPFERASARPTLEVNGIWGGFTGEGIKTVIPCEAHAKITCRLVPDQRPAEIREKLLAHIRRHAPAYAEVTVDSLPGEADPYLIPADHPAQQALVRVLTAVTGRRPAVTRGFGTVPVMGMVKRILGVETISLGTGQADERAHAPDEFYRLDSFARGQRAYVLLLHELGEALPRTDDIK
ncbi:dipeptidase [Symbiobacterium thermophilum]|nr:dipeptidase [Symbiobacterium thermophilum]MBY6276248.1 dipeptidase [Symbiobacterium thermophilum]